MFLQSYARRRLDLNRSLSMLAVFISATSVLAQSAPPPQATPWPSHQRDELETLLIEGGIGRAYPITIDTKTTFLQQFIERCLLDANGQSNSAQWVRFAYHDMATHNVNGDGLGGLDGSLRFELDRPENVGDGMFVTASQFSGFSSPYVSYADMVAIGLVHAVVGCNGPVVPFRGGRITAMEAGPPGVPEPQGTLDEHVNSFNKQGFNKTEMIELVACGHTLGGVTNPDFPAIVNPSSDGSPVTEFFDSNNGVNNTFDNAVVTEYLSGTTKNPLVAHANRTIVSDFRIFSSDGNKTMGALAQPNYFQSRCSVLFERMINTVSRGTVLTDIITPIPVKVGRSFLTLSNSSLALETSIRFLDNNPGRRVTLKWNDRVSGSKEVYSAPAWAVKTTLTPMATRLGLVPTYQWFHPNISSTTSVSKFWFEVDEGREKPTIYDNGGKGYPIQQDEVVFGSHLSVQSQISGWTVVVGVRNDKSISSVTASLLSFAGIDVPTTSTVPLTLVADGPRTSVPGFSLYEMKLPFRVDANSYFYFDANAQFGSGRSVKEEYLSSFYISDRRSVFDD